MKVAIIHYWLISMRGGEKVVEALLDLYPDAHIYTHVLDSEKMSKKILSKKIVTTFINNLPFAKRLYKLYLPLMPYALQEIDLTKYDLVISSESGPAKGIIPNPNSFHLCYCHSPMRYIWDMYHLYHKKYNIFVKIFMYILLPNLRTWDAINSNQVDCFVANSKFVAKRIEKYYNRKSIVINPPVDINRFLKNNRNVEDFYLYVGQLVDYKRYDLAILACIKLNKKLVIIGDGNIKNASKNIIFLGRQKDHVIEDYYSRAKALIFPGVEDFGIIPVEANAAGCPVIAFKEGGAIETIQDQVTGLFFTEQNVDALCSAIIKLENNYGIFCDRSKYNKHVEKFSRDRFLSEMKMICESKKRIL